MRVEIKIPEVGESITEGVLTAWLRQDGEAVEHQEELFELETDKITMAVPAEAAGLLSVDVPEGEVVQVGQVVGSIETGAERPAASGEQGAASGEQGAASGEQGAASGERGAASGEQGAASGQRRAASGEPEEVVAERVPPVTTPAGVPRVRELAAAGELSPAVRVLVAEHGLDPGMIFGSGKDGRLTKGDVLDFLEKRSSAGPPPIHDEAPVLSPVSPVPRSQKPGAQNPKPEARGPKPEAGVRETRQRMSPLRQRVAQRLVQAQQTAAMLTTFNEVDMSAVIFLRKEHGEAFLQRHGVKLGFMSFFMRAVVEGLQSVPQLNARIDGDDLVQQHYHDIGVAVSTERGLVVPVVRDAESLSFAAIEQQIADLAARARQRKLTLAELNGGCFTISNGGVFGSLLSTPILNPPQSGILGLHKIQKRTVVVDDQIVIRPMMYLALSYDHRVVDGAQAVTFLTRVVHCLEQPERLLLQV